MRTLLWALVIIISVINNVFAYTPLLDEVEGINGNNNNYLIMPAWENLDPANRQHAYFVIPKYLVIGGNVDDSQPKYQFGVSHRGYTLFPNGTADYPPSMDLLATIVTYKNDSDISAIHKALTDRDTAAGLGPPVFPDPVFEKFEGSAVVAGAASPTALDAVNGGYPGQLTLIHVTPPPDVLPSLILDLPTSAGREAALWGVVLKGTIRGYANRLKCTITVHHHKVYDHFKARASGQAYWGLVKADLAREVKKMDQDQSIDFGLCRGSADQIEKIVMPVWQKITELTDQNGNTMFADMIKSMNGIPNHPEASAGGWGFQTSAGWETVDYKDQTVINFDISFQDRWTLIMGMSFSTQCSKWKSYFINNTNTARPCVDPKDLPAIRDKQRTCFGQFLSEIKNNYPEDVRASAYKRLSSMGCAWDGSYGVAQNDFDTTLTPQDAAAGRMCRSRYLLLLERTRKKRAIGDQLVAEMMAGIGKYGCAWRGGATVTRLHDSEFLDELDQERRGIERRLHTE